MSSSLPPTITTMSLQDMVQVVEVGKRKRTVLSQVVCCVASSVVGRELNSDKLRLGPILPPSQVLPHFPGRPCSGPPPPPPITPSGRATVTRRRHLGRGKHVASGEEGGGGEAGAESFSSG